METENHKEEKKVIDYFRIIITHKKLIILFTALAFSLGIIITIVQAPKYSSKIQTMVVQRDSPDAYNSARSVDRIARNLAMIIPTTSFLDKINEAEMVDLSNLVSLEEKEKREKWVESVSVNVVPETGILNITAYAENRIKAQELANAIAYTLDKKSNEYYGSSDNIYINIINTPLTSKYPASPNIFLNVIFSIIFGFFISVLFVIARAEGKKIGLFDKNKNNKNNNNQEKENQKKENIFELNKNKTNNIEKINDKQEEVIIEKETPSENTYRVLNHENFANVSGINDDENDSKVISIHDHINKQK